MIQANVKQLLFRSILTDIRLVFISDSKKISAIFVQTKAGYYLKVFNRNILYKLKFSLGINFSYFS